MKMWEALKLLEVGKNIRRKCWEEHYSLGLDKNNNVMEVYQKGDTYNLADIIIYGCDLKANDWEIYK